MDIYRVAKRRGKYPTLATLATVKLRISCAIYLRAIREKMASPFASATSEEMIQIIFWCILSILKQLFTSVNFNRELPPLR